MDLYAFSQWLRDNGVPESHLLLYRRGAESLMRDLGGEEPSAARLGEAIHALSLAGASPRAVANLQRVGEALLRFQAAGSEPATPLPAPIEEIRPPRPPPVLDLVSPDGALDDDDAFLPVAKREVPESAPPPATATAAGARRAPAAPAPAPSVVADLPAAIEEEQAEPTATAAASAPAAALDSALELAAPGATAAHAADAAAVPAPRHSGDVVRCPRCGRMQPRRAEGTCEACFAPFPHPITPDAAPSPAPEASRRRSARSRRGPIAALVAVAVLGGVALGGARCGRQAVSGCSERFVTRPVPAAGLYQVAHLDLTIDFPRGWRHATAQDRTRVTQSVTARTASFARGERMSRPDQSLLVAVLPLAGGFAEASTLDDDGFVRFLDLNAHGIARNLASEGGTWLGAGCAPLTRAGRRLGRCRGVARRGGEPWNVTTYVILGAARAVIAVFASTAPLEATRLEDELIAASISP